MTPPLYDTIGINYANLRRPDPRFAAAIRQTLGDAQSVINVGAGAGSYEPADRDVTALEPSMEMIRQRPADAAPAIQGVAEDIPFGDNSFDAALAVLTMHHWTDAGKGLSEMKRVARDRVVIFTFDPAHGLFWLADYIPELDTLDREWGITPEIVSDALGTCEISTVPVPHDCQDGFLGAYWRRPEAYLEARVRAAISSFSRITDTGAALDQLRADLASGAWHERYGDLLDLTALDCGYRLITARLAG